MHDVKTWHKLDAVDAQRVYFIFTIGWASIWSGKLTFGFVEAPLWPGVKFR